LSAERLHELLSYSETTGLFTWLPRLVREGTELASFDRTWNTRYAGAVAGYLDSRGYRRIKVDGHRYAAHRLALLYLHGEWPALDADHKDNCPDNNRIDNLRTATQSENNANRRRFCNNKSGFKGVRAHRRRYQAQIRKDGRLIHIGTFDTAEAAAQAYFEKAKELFGEFARAA
jgi:HNH endonuclease/AP2 domain